MACSAKRLCGVQEHMAAKVLKAIFCSHDWTMGEVTEFSTSHALTSIECMVILDNYFAMSCFWLKFKICSLQGPRLPTNHWYIALDLTCLRMCKFSYSRRIFQIIALSYSRMLLRCFEYISFAFYCFFFVATVVAQRITINEFKLS